MTVLLTALSVVFTLVAAYHIVTPFLASGEDQLRFEALDEDLRRVEELAARRATILQELRAIRLDFETGKITEEDYEKARRRHETKALGVMRELDDLHGGRGWEDTIDEQLAERLEKLDAEERETAEAPRDPVDDVEEALVACDECGKKLEPEARFCSRCGTPLREESAETVEPADGDGAPGDDEQLADDNQLEDDDAVEQAAAPSSRPLTSSGSEVAT
ncbi:MAG: zinc-ribbon domain-containing protein [Persicimonas sp.]